MKVAILLFAILCTTGFSYCQTWKSTGVEKPGSEIFYNADNVMILNIGNHKNVVKAWCREKFYNQLVAGEFYSSGYILTSYLFDYNEKRWSINELIYHRPSGQVIRDYTYEPEWHETPPGSPIALLFLSICRKYSEGG
jgi:hypothetical protein